jgi:hypothetical protein
MLPPLMRWKYKGEIYMLRKAGTIHATTAETPLALLENEKLVRN